MTEAEVRALKQLVERELRKWRDHEDFADIVQEAWLKSWQQSEALHGQWAVATVVRVCSRAALSSWLRSRKGRRQIRPAGRAASPECGFLEDLAPGEEPAGEEFAPRLIEQIVAAQVSGRALAAMSVHQRAMVRETIMADQPFERVAAARGTDRGTVWKSVQRGLALARLALDKEREAEKRNA